MKKVILMFAAAATLCACSNSKTETPAANKAEEVVNAAAENCGKCCKEGGEGSCCAKAEEAPCCAMMALQAEVDSLKALGDQLDEAGKAKLAELEQKAAELKEAAEAKLNEGKDAVENAVEAGKQAAGNAVEAGKQAANAAKEAAGNLKDALTK